MSNNRQQSAGFTETRLFTQIQSPVHPSHTYSETVLTLSFAEANSPLHIKLPSSKSQGVICSMAWHGLHVQGSLSVHTLYRLRPGKTSLCTHSAHALSTTQHTQHALRLWSSNKQTTGGRCCSLYVASACAQQLLCRLLHAHSSRCAVTPRLAVKPLTPQALVQSDDKHQTVC